MCVPAGTNPPPAGADLAMFFGVGDFGHVSRPGGGGGGVVLKIFRSPELFFPFRVRNSRPGGGGGSAGG